MSVVTPTAGPKRVSIVEPTGEYHPASSGSIINSRPGAGVASNASSSSSSGLRMSAARPNIPGPGSGSLGDLLLIINIYNQAHAASDTIKMRRIESALRPSMARLDASGLFRLFSVDEWVAAAPAASSVGSQDGGGDGKNASGPSEGRKMVGRLYRDYMWLRA